MERPAGFTGRLCVAVAALAPGTSRTEDRVVPIGPRRAIPGVAAGEAPRTAVCAADDHSNGPGIRGRETRSGGACGDGAAACRPFREVEPTVPYGRVPNRRKRPSVRTRRRIRNRTPNPLVSPAGMGGEGI